MNFFYKLLVCGLIFDVFSLKTNKINELYKKIQNNNKNDSIKHLIKTMYNTVIPFGQHRIRDNVLYIDFSYINIKIYYFTQELIQTSVIDSAEYYNEQLEKFFQELIAQKNISIYSENLVILFKNLLENLAYITKKFNVYISNYKTIEEFIEAAKEVVESYYEKDFELIENAPDTHPSIRKNNNKNIYYSQQIQTFFNKIYKKIA